MTDEQPTHLDLFSGIGGFALAASWAGFRTVGFCENDPCCQQVLAKNFPGIPLTPDIRNLAPITADLFTAGFPCQPYSVAGQQRGADDNRALWPVLFKVIKTGQPAFCLLENVPGIIELALDQILSDLDSISYATQSFIIPACSLNAPHRRNRVFVVAYSPVHGRKRLQPRAPTQIPQNRPPKTLDPWHRSGNPFQNWEVLLAQPFVRRMDDGVSSELDVRPRLRAYGNAIVPQVAFQFLKPIHDLILHG